MSEVIGAMFSELGENQQRVVIVTGLSGAGKSTAIHALEDLGFFCVDNLPTTVVPRLLEVCREASVRRVALGIDVRVGAFLKGFGEAVEVTQQDSRVALSVVFLDANDTTLLNRFSATRRPHPLSTSPDRNAEALLDGIGIEREQLWKVRVRATDVIDTTGMTVHDLRRRVVELFGPGAGRGHRMRVRMLSFGFKYGPPIDADLMLDVRFLPNPFFIDVLRSKTGLDEDVASYVFGFAETDEFVEKAAQLISFCIPRYEREGKSYLTVAIGCTGGQHRSVAIAAELGKRVAEECEIEVSMAHRDIQRGLSLERLSQMDIIGSGGVRGTGKE